MAAGVATVRITSIIPASPMPTCRFFTVTFFSSLCAISSPVKKLRSTTNQRSTPTKKGASVEHLPAAERSIRFVRETGKGVRVKGNGGGEEAIFYPFPISHFPVSPFQSLGSVKLNVDPRPTSESRPTVPPCCSTTSRTKDRPSPVDSSSFSCPSRTTR